MGFVQGEKPVLNVSECRSMGVLEVTQPALKDGIELADNGLQATATGAAGLLADLIPKRLPTFRTHPASTRLKPIA